MQRSALQKNVDILKYKTLSFKLSAKVNKTLIKSEMQRNFFFGAKLLVRTASNWSFELMIRDLKLSDCRQTKSETADIWHTDSET